MDLTALTWQASVVLIYVSFNREAGVANATLASFCGHGPTFPTLDADVTVVGCVALDAPPRFARWLWRLTGDRAVPAIWAPGRACNDVRVGMKGIG